MHCLGWWRQELWSSLGNFCIGVDLMTWQCILYPYPPHMMQVGMSHSLPQHLHLHPIPVCTPPAKTPVSHSVSPASCIQCTDQYRVTCSIVGGGPPPEIWGWPLDSLGTEYLFFKSLTSIDHYVLAKPIYDQHIDCRWKSDPRLGRLFMDQTGYSSTRWLFRIICDF